MVDELMIIPFPRQPESTSQHSECEHIHQSTVAVHSMLALEVEIALILLPTNFQSII